MIEQDTIKLLRECDAGAKMGIESIDEVLPYVQHKDMKDALEDSENEHQLLEREIHQALNRYGDRGKDPAPIAETMSWLKTNVKLVMSESDKTIAELMTDGCDMGTKSLRRYLNQYKAADEDSKRIAEKLIRIEENLRTAMAPML